MADITTTNSKLRFKHILEAGKRPAIGTFMMLKGARTAQVVANTGLDVIVVDCEHGNIGDADMHDTVLAASASGVSPVVRVRGITAPLIKRALDTGAHGILVPMVNTAADARAVVAFAKFPPLGIRGQGSPFACFEHGLSTPSEYVAQANDNLITIVQIESVEGLRNVDEICQVDGVDAIFIGPNDLALALLGYTPAKYTEKVFLDAIEKIVTTAKKHKKKVGILVVDGESAKKAISTFDFLLLGADVRALQGWYRRELEIARL